MKRAVLSGLCLVPALAAPAIGDDDPVLAAYAFYQAGAFADAAAHIGDDADADADARALAAKALNAQAVFAEAGEGRETLIAEARAHAEAAIGIDPDHVEAHLQLAIVVWLEGRELSRWEGYRLGLPQEGRRLIDVAMVEAPQEPWAHALLGAWHLEVARRGGRAGMALLGARIDVGAEHFYEAMRLDPDDAAIAAQCGISFLALNRRRYEEHARIALERAVAAEANDAFETAMRDEAQRLLALMSEGEWRALDEAVSRFVEG